MRRTRNAAAVFVLAVLPVTAAFAAARVEAPTASSRLLAEVADEAWRYVLERDVDLRSRRGLPIERLPSYDDAERREEVEHARAQLERLRAIAPAELTADERVTLGTLRWSAERTIELSRFAALDFQVTPYALSFYTVSGVFEKFSFGAPADGARYLDLLGQHARGFRTLRANLAAKRAAGVLLPRPEVELVAAFLRSLDVDAAESFAVPKAERLGALDEQAAAKLLASIAARYETEVRPAYRELVAFFDEGYRSAAPEAVGLGQYPGGADYYAALVRFHTTLDLTPEEIHRLGLEIVGRIEERMAGIRRELGFAGTAREFNARLRSDPRFLAKTPAEVEERLLAPMRAFAPKLPELFGRLPKAPYGVARLDPALEGAMTFGYYQPPTPPEARGLYYFNGSKLDERPLIGAAALIFHELAPGHHFQIALQAENDALPPIRRESWTTAFGEGWAEYASKLAEEHGGVAGDPYALYGRLLMEMFVSTRLVVDTGMNRLGWSREKAAEFMRERLIETDTQIATETLRYSCDIPGQALGYELGAWKLAALRDRARSALGARFDLRAFHDLVLATGSVPLTVLEARVEEWIAEVASGS